MYTRINRGSGQPSTNGFYNIYQVYKSDFGCTNVGDSIDLPFKIGKDGCCLNKHIAYRLDIQTTIKGDNHNWLIWNRLYLGGHIASCVYKPHCAIKVAFAVRVRCTAWHLPLCRRT